MAVSVEQGAQRSAGARLARASKLAAEEQDQRDDATDVDRGRSPGGRPTRRGNRQPRDVVIADAQRARAREQHRDRDQTNATAPRWRSSVSMVVARCRAFVEAARWNGQAPHTTTGARGKANPLPDRNCRAGTIASSTTGRVSTAQPSPADAKRRSRPAVGYSTASAACSGSTGFRAASGVTGRLHHGRPGRRG